jgi:hypothetical protein
MTLKVAKQLKPGYMVFIRDIFSPNEGSFVTIREIDFDDRLVIIKDTVGNIIKCYPEDLE